MSRIILVITVLTAFAVQSSASTYERQRAFNPDQALNKLLLQHWQQKNLPERRISSDAVFLRRLTLTLMGRLPRHSEVQDFLRDEEPDKRSRWIKRYLGTADYADMQAMRFADMLRIKSEFPINLWPNAVQFYHRTLRDDILKDRSLKCMFYEMLTVSGSNFRTAYANFFRASADRSPSGLAKMVLLTTMGMRESALSEKELADFAKLFSCVRYKSTYEWKEEIVFHDIEPRELEGALPDGSSVSINTGKTDPRKIFADWLLDDDNDYFARAMTNKVWHWIFGRGIYPVADDLPRLPGFWEKLWNKTVSDNVPFSEEVQAYLIKEFKQNNYSLKHLYEVILNSAAFQVSALDQSEDAVNNFASYPVRRLESELLIDALAQITLGYDRYMSVIPEPFTFLPGTTKAINIADGSISTGVLDSFGRPPRDSGQFSERNTASTDSQGLYLMNSAALHRRIQSYCNRIQRIHQSDNTRLDRIYLDILSRYPTTRERDAFRKYQSELSRQEKRMVWSDTVWVLMNSKEFIFHH